MENSLEIEINNLSFHIGTKVIFDKININIPKGKIIAIMGPSGTGKTTLLRLINRQLITKSGNIFFRNDDIAKFSQHNLYAYRRKLGMLFQSNALFSDLSVFENVAFPLREHTKLSERIIRIIVLLKLQAVGLRGAAELMPNQLSGGMARRVSLARAIALDPELMLFDEPFTGQDPISLGAILKLVKLLNDSLGMTSIIVSHDVQKIATIADYMYIVANSKIVGEGTPESLINHSGGWIQQFMQGLYDGPIPFHYPACAYEEDLWAKN